MVRCSVPGTLSAPAAVKEEKKASQNETAYYRTKQQKSEDAKRRSRIKAVENEIAEADDRLAAIENEMTLPEICADYEKMTVLCAEMSSSRRNRTPLWTNGQSLRRSNRGKYCAYNSPLRIYPFCNGSRIPSLPQ